MFKEFAIKGGDISAAFVLGTAFRGVVTGFTSGVVSQVIGLIFKLGF